MWICKINGLQSRWILLTAILLYLFALITVHKSLQKGFRKMDPLNFYIQGGENHDKPGNENTLNPVTTKIYLVFPNMTQRPVELRTLKIESKNMGTKDKHSIVGSKNTLPSQSNTKIRNHDEVNLLHKKKQEFLDKRKLPYENTKTNKSERHLIQQNEANQEEIKLLNHKNTSFDSTVDAIECNIFSGKRCQLAAVILVRIYEYDKPKWNKDDLEQWIQYMLYAGVSHVYLYDNYLYPNESLKTWTSASFSRNLVTYHDWSKYQPYTISGTQENSYQHALDTYGKHTIWQIAFDMDEYPFCPNDIKRGFLNRVIDTLSDKHQGVSEFSIKNILFLGKPRKSSKRTLFIERVLRRTPEPANHLDKPIYRTDKTLYCSVHHNVLKSGISMDVDIGVLRMNHYWGARLQNWGNDTIEIINMTIPDDSALQSAKYLKDYIAKKTFV